LKTIEIKHLTTVTYVCHHPRSCISCGHTPTPYKAFVPKSVSKARRPDPESNRWAGIYKPEARGALRAARRVEDYNGRECLQFVVAGATAAAIAASVARNIAYDAAACTGMARLTELANLPMVPPVGLLGLEDARAQAGIRSWRFEDCDCVSGVRQQRHLDPRV
jgi:hypothetical protein